MDQPEAVTSEQIQAATHAKRLQRAQAIAEDDLRRRMIEQVPEIRHEVGRMENILRDLVDLERLKIPPETGRGYFVLNKRSKGKYSGIGSIGAKKYKIRGVLAQDPSGKEILKITLFPM